MGQQINNVGENKIFGGEKRHFQLNILVWTSQVTSFAPCSSPMSFPLSLTAASEYVSSVKNSLKLLPSMSE